MGATTPARSRILAVGRAVPDRVVSNDDLGRRMDTSDEWIQQRTGIRQRLGVQVLVLRIHGDAAVPGLLRRELETVASRVREGQSFAGTLLDRQTVPDVAVKMIEVGEQTGALTEMLNSLADFYDEEIETEVSRFVTLIEPAMLVFMGVVIAGIVLSLYLPLFQLTSVIGQS